MRLLHLVVFLRPLGLRLGLGGIAPWPSLDCHTGYWLAAGETGQGQGGGSRLGGRPAGRPHHGRTLAEQHRQHRHPADGDPDGGTQHDGAGSVTRMSTLTVTQRNGRITQSSKNSTVITAIVESNINGDDDFAKLCDADREIDKLSDITRDADSNKNNINSKINF